MTIDLYGIRNCDTVKKARAWFEEQGTAVTFHDFKAKGVDEDALRRWIGGLGWERVLNRQGTTFRKLADGDRQSLEVEGAIALMLAHPSMIKRPIVEGDGVLTAGFQPEAWAVLRG